MARLLVTCLFQLSLCFALCFASARTQPLVESPSPFPSIISTPVAAGYVFDVEGPVAITPVGSVTDVEAPAATIPGVSSGIDAETPASTIPDASSGSGVEAPAASDVGSGIGVEAPTVAVGGGEGGSGFGFGFGTFSWGGRKIWN